MPSSEQAPPSGDAPASVLMWEAKAAPGRLDELLAHALAQAAPEAQVYCSADDRVVVIDPTGVGVDATPGHLVDRAPHAWPFRPVPRP